MEPMQRLSKLQDMKDRVAVITGGAGPLALAYAETLAECGASIVVVDLKEEACAARASAIEAHSAVSCLPLALDVSQPDSAQNIVARTLARFGRLDIIINNAAFTGTSGLAGYAVPFPEQSLEAWEAALRVNLTSAFSLVQAARGALATSGRGSVINIASIYGVVGPNMGLYEGTSMGNPAAYAATKGGLVQLTRYLATALAPSIRVNCVSPGGIERGQPATFQRRYNALTPLGRMGREEDLKGVIAFLASDASAFVTGQNIMVDGGWTAW